MGQEKKINKPLEVVVLFDSKELRNGLTVYEPKFIDVGYFNEEKMEFTDLDNNIFKHFIMKDEFDLGFGLRMKLSELREIYPIKDLKLLFKVYLKELKQRRYYFAHKSLEEREIKDLLFVSEDKKYHTILEEKDVDLEKILKATDPFLDINKLISNINGNVIGQDEAVEEIVSILWQNSKRKNKRNTLLIGPTGVGKTELIRTLKKFLVNVPITTVDVSNFTKTGYKGDSVTDILIRALNQFDGDIYKLEHSVIVLDEFDKLAKSGNDDITTTGVQHELLKILEDGEYTLELGDGVFNSDKVTVNTKEISFILAGAFSGLFEEEKVSRPIGLGYNYDEKPKEVKKKKITSEDLKKFGIIEEAIGRIHNIVVLNSLTEENLISIMKNPNSYILNDNLKLFEELGVTVHIRDGVYKKIAKMALDKHTGARGLIGTVETLFSKASLDAKKNVDSRGYNYLEITEDTVLDNRNYILKKVLTKREDK